MADKSNRERGLRAAIHNPRVSEQAKQRDREILETEFGEHFEAGEAGQAASTEPEPENPPLRMKQTLGLRSTSGMSFAATTASFKAKPSPSNHYRGAKPFDTPDSKFLFEVFGS